MLFREKPWNFLQKFPNVLSTESFGLYGINIFDPFLERLYQSRMSHFIKENLGLEYNVLIGKELTVNWLEDNVQTPGLFSKECCYLVLNSEDISSKVQEFLLETELNLPHSYFVLSFSRSTKLFQGLSVKKNGIFYSIEMVKYWEFDKLLDFLSGELKVKLNQEVKKYLLANTENDSGSFINSLKLIKLHFGNKIPGRDEITKLIPPNRLDSFQMASLLSRKQRKEFFGRLLEFEIESSNWQQFINFIIGHLIKLLDPSTLSLSGTQYERDLLNLSKLWSKEELLKEINFFGDLQIEAKGKKNLKEKLRLALLANS